MARLTRSWLHLAAAAALLQLASTTVSAQDVSWSAFGTIGAAISDQSWTYQRYIDNKGTLNRDSVLGVQMDAKLSSEWSATVQGKLAPSDRKDDQWSLSASWAFVSWRPSNEWLIRAGKLRIPLYMFSENLDVGQSYDLARMPTETYSIAPLTDTTGLYVTRTWALDNSEISVDVLSGGADVYHRFYARDTGADIRKVYTRVHGATFTWRQDDLTVFSNWLHASTNIGGSVAYPRDLAYQPIGGGLGIYMPMGNVARINNDVFSLGVDWRFGHGWRVIAEAERNVQHDTTMGANTYGGHVALLKTIGRWTPYTVVSAISSTDAQRKMKKELDAIQIPAYVPYADAMNAGQRQLSDAIPFYDQHTLAVGTSYSLNSHSKIKAEWAHTWVGQGSTMIDSPPDGAPVSHKGINVLSLSYNFAF